MTKSIPGYLRLHNSPITLGAATANSDPRSVNFGVSDASATTSDARRTRVGREQESAAIIGHFWDAYTATTGWRIDAKNLRSGGGVKLLPVAISKTTTDGEVPNQRPHTAENEARRLAELALSLTDGLKKSRRALRRQATELAARAAIISTSPKQDELARSIERLLADVTLACGCNSAALYLLDDDTSTLSFRFGHQLPVDRLESGVRELRGSRGDLEALVQGVVSIDAVKAGPIDTWNCPEDAEAAICASVSVDDLPIGTMWLFSDEPKAFSPSTEATVRITARAVARELAAPSAAQSPPSERQAKSMVRDIASWQHRGLPSGTRLAENWAVDGMIESPNDWAVGWHTWDILPDGTVFVAMAEAVDSSISGAMVAALTRGSLAAHIGYRHSPKQLLQRISDTLWQTNTGDQLISLLCAHIEPETGTGQIATAGHFNALIGSRYGYRAVTTDHSDPLGTSIDGQCVVGSFNLTAGETLLAYGTGWTADGASQRSLGDALRDSFAATAFNPLATLRCKHARRRLCSERGALALSRV